LLLWLWLLPFRFCTIDVAVAIAVPVTVTIAIAVAVAVPITTAVPIPVAATVSISSYYGLLLCVGGRVLDIMDVFITSLIVIVVIIISHPSSAEERRVETCEGGRGCGGDYLGVNTAPLPCCGRTGKASKRMFSLSSLSTTSLKTVFFCKNSLSYKKNK
jgi:hypothetical protein